MLGFQLPHTRLMQEEGFAPLDLSPKRALFLVPKDLSYSCLKAPGGTRTPRPLAARGTGWVATPAHLALLPALYQLSYGCKNSLPGTRTPSRWCVAFAPGQTIPRYPPVAHHPAQGSGSLDEGSLKAKCREGDLHTPTFRPGAGCSLLSYPCVCYLGLGSALNGPPSEYCSSGRRYGRILPV